MRYCNNCGKGTNDESNFCPNCGQSFFKNGANNLNKGSTGTVIVCAIVGLLFPIIGAILYYALKSTDEKAAKTANICSWVGFLWQFLCIVLYGSAIIDLIML